MKVDSHWNGWAAVNPWVQLARVVYERVDPMKKRKRNMIMIFYWIMTGLLMVSFHVMACLKRELKTQNVLYGF